MRLPARRTRSLEGVSKRVAWFLVALGAWSLYIWITLIVIIGRQDHPMSFKIVHDTLAVISIVFGVGAGAIGVKALRSRS
jgi:predicted ferric reductase